MIHSMNRKLRVLLLGALAGMYLGLTGCTTTVAHDGYYHYPSHAWYDYYYYPSVDIYLDISGGYYWYRDHDHWTRVKRLPAHLHPRDHERVFLRLDTERPHTYHQQHRNRYKAAPQRRDDRHGNDQRHGYAPGVKQGHAQMHDKGRPGSGNRSAPPTARQSPAHPTRAVQRTQRRSQPPAAARRDTGGDVGKGAAPDRKNPPAVYRGIGRAPQAAQASERNSDAGSAPQRRNDRGPRLRPDSRETGDTTRNRPPRQVKGESQNRRKRPRGDDRKGPNGRLEPITDDAEPENRRHPPVRGRI